MTNCAICGRITFGHIFAEKRDRSGDREHGLFSCSPRIMLTSGDGALRDVCRGDERIGAGLLKVNVQLNHVIHISVRCLHFSAQIVYTALTYTGRRLHPTNKRKIKKEYDAYKLQTGMIVRLCRAEDNFGQK